MGNRAVITTEGRELGVYVHWNGGRDTVEPVLKYCKMKGYRAPETDCYGWARLCQVWGNFFGGELSVGIDAYSTDEQMNPGDNGIYVIKNWEIVDRIFPYEDYEEQQEYEEFEMLCDIDRSMPDSEQLGKAKIAEALGIAVEPPSRNLRAVKMFLSRKGYELDDDYQSECPFIQLAAYDPEDKYVVFVGVFESGDEKPFKREAYEREMVRYLAGSPHTNCGARYDTCTLMVVGDDSALIRHHINADKEA